MNKHTSYFFTLALVLSAAITSCTKNSEKVTSGDPAPCSAVLYGYSISGASIFPDSAATFGTINLSSATSSSLGSFNNTTYSNQGAFNTSENCYYVFKYFNYGATRTLYKITPSGAVTTITAPAIERMEGLVYDSITNSLYCLKCNNGTPAEVVKISITGTTFSYTTVGTTTRIVRSASPATSTINITTGELYFATMNYSPDGYGIEKFNLATGVATLIASGSDKRIMGLRFNKNDNMLYAIVDNITSTPLTFDFVKITTSGSFSVLSTLPFQVNNEFYSTAFNPCENRYILSTLTDSGWAYRTLHQFNMSGTIVQSDTTSGLYQGMIVTY